MSRMVAVGLLWFWEQLFCVAGQRGNLLKHGLDFADAGEVLSSHFQWDIRGAAGRCGGYGKKRGRPAGSATKEQVAIRFDHDVLAAFRTAGPGWQTRMNDALRDWLKTHSAA